MNPQRLRTAGVVLFAMTALAFVALPFWIPEVLGLLVHAAEAGAVSHLPFPALLFQLFVNLPLLIIASLWIGFLIAWRVSRRAKSAHASQNADHLARTRSRFLILAGAVGLAITALVELFYLDWFGGALGSYLDESDYAVLHLYLYLEVPQFFLVLLWTALLLVAWLPRPNSPAVNPRLYLPLVLLLFAVAGLVWTGYPYWMAGIGAVSIVNQQIPPAALRTFEALPALFVACLWLCFFWYLGSSWRARGRHALGRP